MKDSISGCREVSSERNLTFIARPNPWTVSYRNPEPSLRKRGRSDSYRLGLLRLSFGEVWRDSGCGIRQRGAGLSSSKGFFINYFILYLFVFLFLRHGPYMAHSSLKFLM